MPGTVVEFAKRHEFHIVSATEPDNVGAELLKERAYFLGGGKKRVASGEHLGGVPCQGNRRSPPCSEETRHRLHGPEGMVDREKRESSPLLVSPEEGRAETLREFREAAQKGRDGQRQFDNGASCRRNEVGLRGGREVIRAGVSGIGGVKGAH